MGKDPLSDEKIAEQLAELTGWAWERTRSPECSGSGTTVASR